MADWFVDDAATDNLGTGTWDDPVKYLWLEDGSSNPGLFTRASAPAAGDTVYVQEAHSEIHTSSFTLTNNGTADNLISIVGVKGFNSGSPLVLEDKGGCFLGFSAPGSGLDITLAPNLSIIGFTIATGDEIREAFFSTEACLFLKSCIITLERSATSHCKIYIGNTSEVLVRLEDCDISFASAGRIYWSSRLEMYNCTVLRSGGIPGASTFYNIANGGCITIKDCDLSQETNASVFGHSSDSEALVGIVENSHLATGSSLFNGILYPSTRYTSINSAPSYSGSGEMEFLDKFGSCTSDTSVYRTGGTELDGAGYSLLITPSANIAKETPFILPLVTTPFDGTTATTFEFFLANTSRNLNDCDVEIVVSYNDTINGGNKVRVSSNPNCFISSILLPTDASSWVGGMTFIQKISIHIPEDGANVVARFSLRVSCVESFYLDPSPNIV